MLLDLSYGDEVTAIALDGTPVSGVVISLDWGPDDKIKAAAVGSYGIPRAVRPETIRYAVDRNGFSFSIPNPNTLIIRRNDTKLTQSAWLRRRGVRLLRDSLVPKKRRR